MNSPYIHPAYFRAFATAPTLARSPLQIQRQNNVTGLSDNTFIQSFPVLAATPTVKVAFDRADVVLQKTTNSSQSTTTQSTWQQLKTTVTHLKDRQLSQDEKDNLIFVLTGLGNIPISIIGLGVYALQWSKKPDVLPEVKKLMIQQEAIRQTFSNLFWLVPWFGTPLVKKAFKRTHPDNPVSATNESGKPDPLKRFLETTAVTSLMYGFVRPMVNAAVMTRLLPSVFKTK